MSKETKKSKGWPVVGSIRKNENGSYIKLADNVEILVDGVKMQMNKARVLKLDDPRKKVDFLLERGFIDETEADKRRERLADMAWLKYDIVLAPDKKAE